MRVEKWEERDRDSHREKRVWGPDYQREERERQTNTSWSQSDGLIFAEKERKEGRKAGRREGNHSYIFKIE